MTALALALALAAQSPLGSWAPSPTSTLPPWAGGRVYTSRTVHVGIRPAAYVDNEARGGLEGGAGATVQVSWLGQP